MTVRTLRQIVIGGTAAAVLAGTAAVAGQDVVQIRLRGRYYSEPATIRVTVAVEPGADNRSLVIQADGDQLFRSSQFALEGEHDRRLHTVEFRNLPAGNYVLRAEVRSHRDVIGAAEESLVVGDPGDR